LFRYIYSYAIAGRKLDLETQIPERMDRRRRVKRIMKIIHLRVKKGIYRTVSKPALTPSTSKENTF
jgi:hypothetical protein